MKSFFEEVLKDRVLEVQELGSGFLSTAYKIICERKKYVARKVSPGASGFEHVHDIKTSFSHSHTMYQNAYAINKVESVAVFEKDSDVFHIQEFLEGSVLFDVGNISDKQILTIAEKIAGIHNLGKAELDMKKLEKQAMYRRSLRETLTHNETLFSIYESKETSSHQKKLLEKISLRMLESYFELIAVADVSRLSYLHGDFWHGNIIGQGDDVFFIDFSRIPYGEPGIDVGTFVGNFEIQYLHTGDQKLLEKRDLFLKKYIEITSDGKIKDYLVLSKLWVLFLHLSPLLQSFLKWDEMRQKNIYERFLAEFV